MHIHSARIHASARLAVLLAAATLFAGCAETPQRPTHHVEQLPPPPPSSQVYFYPLQGQSAAQQDRDKYECYGWARNKTGFDPSAAPIAMARQVEVTPQPSPGHDTAVGAIAGAVLGAAVSSRHHAVGGAIIGATAGALVGAASDSARDEQAQRIQERYDQRTAATNEQRAGRVNDYRRAMAACLEGRGYSVQ